MFHKITSLATLPDYILLVGFANGEFKQFDLKPLMDKYPPFATLKDVDGLYEQAKIDAGGYGIVWNDDLDISADGIYEKGVACVAPDDVDDVISALFERGRVGAERLYFFSAEEFRRVPVGNARKGEVRRLCVGAAGEHFVFLSADVYFFE